MMKTINDMGPNETIAMGLIAVMAEIHDDDENFEKNLMVARAICDHTGFDFEQMIEFFADGYAQTGDLKNHKKALDFLKIYREAIQLDLKLEQKEAEED